MAAGEKPEESSGAEEEPEEPERPSPVLPGWVRDGQVAGRFRRSLGVSVLLRSAGKEGGETGQRLADGLPHPIRRPTNSQAASEKVGRYRRFHSCHRQTKISCVRGFHQPGGPDPIDQIKPDPTDQIKPDPTDQINLINLHHFPFIDQ